MGGYAGKILFVDLGSGKIEKQDLDMGFAREYMGGLGFGTKIYLDLIKDKPQFDALSGDNPIVIMTGPLTGVKMSATARWTVGSKSPLTGFWGDSNVGGFFGSYLKLAGYDGIVLTGEAEKPTYLYINDGVVELRDADKYWGKDTYKTNDEMIADLRSESKKAGQVLTIGPAGETLVKYASLVNRKGHVAGRTGMGAVWGAKKLKAIYVTGTGTIDVAKPDRLKEMRKELKDVYGESVGIMAIYATGTATQMDVGIISGDIPIKNWQMTDWDEIDDIGPMAVNDKMYTGSKTCYGCGVACKKEAEVKEGPFKFEKGPSPEYETLASFGAMCLNSNLESIGKANALCNEYGMDTISCGTTIAFAIDCFDNGLIDESDTDGLKLTWGNAEAIIELVKKIGNKEGFGAVLAEGSLSASKHIGKNAADYLTTVKGLEAPMHDPRSAHGYGLAYAVSPRGACHEASLTFEVEGGAMYFPEIPVLAEDFPEGSEGRAKLNVACQDFGMFFSNCAIFCNLGGYPLNATMALDMMNTVTGFDYTLAEVMEAGRRIWYMKRGLSNLFGARAADDTLPKRLMTPMQEGPTEGSVPDMALMLKEFYELRQLNEDGIPEKKVLDDMGLTVLADLLYP